MCLSLSNAIFLNLSIGLLSFKKYTNSYTPFDPWTFCSIGSDIQGSESKRTYFLQESQGYYIPAFWQPNLVEESPIFVIRQLLLWILRSCLLLEHISLETLKSLRIPEVILPWKSGIKESKILDLKTHPINASLNLHATFLPFSL
jgi:hypothetical protein